VGVQNAAGASWPAGTVGWGGFFAPCSVTWTYVTCNFIPGGNVVGLNLWGLNLQVRHALQA
jgi:hypothetical protein